MGSGKATIFGRAAAPACRTAALFPIADRGGPVLGICNGLQILCEAGLLPGALSRNDSLRFVCRTVPIRVETSSSPVTGRLTPGEVLEIPIKHGEGRYVVDDDTRTRVKIRRQ